MKGDEKADAPLAMQAEPGVTISRHVLRVALKQAEEAADRCWSQISGLESSREIQLGQVAACTEQIRAARERHLQLSAQVRQLQHAASCQ